MNQPEVEVRAEHAKTCAHVTECQSATKEGDSPLLRWITAIAVVLGSLATLITAIKG